MSETKEQGPEGVFPEDLDRLLAEADKIVSQISKRRVEPEKLLKMRNSVLKKIEEIKQKIAQQEVTVEDIDSALRKRNYETLIQIGILNEKDRERLEKLNVTIEQMETSKKFLTSEERLLLEELKNRREAIFTKIKNSFQERQSKIETKIKRFSEALTRLTQFIEKLESIEGVREAIINEENKVIENIYASFQSIRDRLNTAFERLKNVIGEDFEKRLLEAFERKDRRAILNWQKEIIKRASNLEIKNKSEIIPWYMPSKHHFGRSLEYINNEETKKILIKRKEDSIKAAEILEKLEEINKKVNALRLLFNSKFVQVLESTWKSTQQLKELQEKGGLVIEEQGKVSGILPEIKVSKKGNIYIEISEIAGPAKKYVVQGSTYLIIKEGEKYTTKTPAPIKAVIENWLNKQETRKIIEDYLNKGFKIGT